MADDTGCGFAVSTESFVAEFFGLFGGLLVYFTEKTNFYVKSHACNAIIWGSIYFVIKILMIICSALASINDAAHIAFTFFNSSLGFLMFALWCSNWTAALRYSKSQEFKALPYVDVLAMKWADCRH